VYGGAVASDEDSGTALLSRAAAIAVEERVQYLDLRNWHEAQPVPVSPRLHRSGLYVAFDQVISPDEDALMRGFPRDTRRMIRLGPKNDLLAEIGGEELLDPFFDVYAYSLRSLGTPVFPKRLFRAFLRAFSGRCKILVVRHGGQVASAVLSFFFRDTVAPYYAGAYPHFYKSGVNYFMYWELMRAAATDGYTRFDFGRSKRGTGAYEFKRGWGMNQNPLPYASLPIRARTVPNLTPTNSKFRLAIRAWQHLPLRLTTAIGPLIVRNLP
jgi:FemAB-related protein (PEP-CTERM system-associated)